ncbi:TRAP transporter small permease [Salicibibacter kimchii]|uniref:TRAP transporter small permease n=1 Tax=Salicibibacter kimchii TaxID=2099786 RepID=A0A345C190_9BACI|nr:TRAP transporter small permease [Salicibibacter kimchii]AXF56971.1 TRAP transporter small permease [Salicibibacter kimchii]
MTAVSDFLAKIEKLIAALLVLTMAVLIVTAVVFRYFLNTPLSWAGEITIFLFIWMSFVGGSLGLKYKSQASVTVLLDRIPIKWKKVILILGYLIMLGFMVIVLYYSYTWVFSQGVANQSANASQIPMWIPYSAIPFGLTFATVHLLANSMNLIREENFE